MGSGETLIAWLGRTEPLWLFVVLMIEMVAGIYSAVILTIEYKYDRDWNERLRARRKKKMDFEELTQGEHK
jgi:hypothetical protein